MTAKATTFDSLEYCETMKELGMSEAEAKIHATVFQKIFEGRYSDALAYYANLREADVPEKQAMVHARFLQDVLWKFSEYFHKTYFNEKH